MDRVNTQHLKRTYNQPGGRWHQLQVARWWPDPAVLERQLTDLCLETKSIQEIEVNKSSSKLSVILLLKDVSLNLLPKCW